MASSLSPGFIANRDAYADDWRRKKIDRILMLLLGAFRDTGQPADRPPVADLGGRSRA
ncbi:MAG: hypothetical protein JRG90_05965 [Deltaproteobacteria bacterium]|nr:hypothetical protein [Deltaproteobacteria bacterium]